MKTRALLLALPLVALALGGCRDNRASVTIHGICSLPATCTFAGKCDTFYLSPPAIDAATSPQGELWVALEVENQLPDNTNQSTFHTNTNNAHVDEVIVTYDGVALPKQVMGAQQLVPSGGTSVVVAQVIPASLGALPTLAAYAPSATPREMTVVLKLGGYWDDGSRWETGEFPIAIQVCSGCIPTCTTVKCGEQGALPQACE